MARIPKPHKYLPMTLSQLWQSIFKFKQDEIFISWLKRFLVGYNVLFAGLTITFIIANPPIPSGLYLIFLAVIILTFFLLWIPLRWFQVILPFSIPGYIVFIHFFLNYTGGSASPYFPLYFLPVILASFLFSYIGAAVTILFVTLSHMNLESLIFSGIPFYLISHHFITHDLPFFTVVTLLGIMVAFIADWLKEDKEKLSHLFVQAETAKNAFKRELEITKTLYNIDRVILSTMDKKEVLQLCLSNLKPLLDIEYMSIAILEPEKDEFNIVIASFAHRMYEDNKPIPFNATILKSTISSRTSRYYADVRAEDLLSGDNIIKVYGIKSLLTVPLIAKGSPIGSLNLGSLKPNRFSKEDIVLAEGYALHMAIAIDNSKLYAELQNFFMSTILSFSSAIDAKSSWTQNHSSQVTNYAIAIARRFGLDESSIEDLRIAVLLHDIGKIGIPDSILNKTSRLSKEEVEEMQKHPLYGVAILQPIQEMKRIVPIVRHHHEYWDGTGYPDRLSGNMIPLGARIVSIADAFEAMATDRPYRKKMTLKEIKAELLMSSGTQFDPQLVAIFLSLLEEKSMPF